ncbi:MAG TPA: protein kinase [Kofleriaceae bacterium]|nr:protein kinase [Kofleriaceae bacterium]
MAEGPDPEAATVDASSSGSSGPARVRPPAQPATLASGTKIDRYIIERPLGAGGMGVVYAARDPELDRRVAIKLLHAGAPAERLRREAQALAKLHHPNVVTVFDVGQHDGQSFVAMALVDGKNLRTWQRDARPVRESLRVILEAGRGLVAAHDAGLMHRDFKPDNVFVSHHGNVLVGDFGLARSADDAPDASGSDLSAADTGLTMTGALVGTPAYMAPEQARGEPEVASDQFAFCVTAWELLYGERPFAGSNVDEVMDAIEHGRIVEPKDDRGVPSRVRRALERGMAARPADRWPTIDALLTELSGQRARRRRLAVLAAIAVIGCFAIAWGVSRWTSSPASRCRPADERLAGTWNDATRKQLRAYLVAAAPFAETAIDNAMRGIDRYSGNWKRAWVKTCSAKEISDTAFDLEIQCLDRRLTSLGITVGELRTADAKGASNVLESVELLPDITACGDATTLRKVSQAPAAKQPQIKELENRITRAETLTALGKWNEARDQFATLDHEVAALEFAPLAARAALAHAGVELTTERWPDAKRLLESAIAQSNASGDDATLGHAYVDLANVSRIQGDVPHAKELAAIAKAVVHRIGDPRALTDNLALVDAELLAADGKLDDAITALGRLISASEPTDVRQRAKLEKRRADLLIIQGHVDEAAAAYDAALKDTAVAVGENHPLYGERLAERGQFTVLRGKVADGLADWDRAYKILVGTVGPDDPTTVETEEHLAGVDVWLGRYDQGLARERHVVEVRERLSGAEDTTRYRVEYTHLLLIAGKVADAEREIERSLEVARKTPRTPLIVPDAERELAMVRLAQGRVDDAQKIFDDSLRTVSKVLASDNDALELWWVAGARISLARGNTDAAIQQASKVTRGIEIGEAKLVLAQALAKKGDRAGATKAIEESYAMLEGLMPGGNARPDLRAQLAKLKASL